MRVTVGAILIGNRGIERLRVSVTAVNFVRGCDRIKTRRNLRGKDLFALQCHTMGKTWQGLLHSMDGSTWQLAHISAD